MRGHIRKRGDKWSVVIDVGRDDEGRRRQRWHSGYDTKREASKALTDLLSRLQGGTYVEPSRQTLALYLREWLDAIRATVRPSTWTSYSLTIETYILPALGSVPLQNLTAAQLNGMYGDLLTHGRRLRSGGLSPRTVRYTHTVLRKALKEAVRWNRVPRNIADQADPPRSKATAAHQMRTWSAGELRAFLDHVREDRLYAAWLLASTTGMRRGEVLGLRWRDVDLDGGRLSVSQTLISVRNSLSFSTPKTAKGRRSVALDPVTVGALRQHRKRQVEERLSCGPGYADADLVFARQNGSALHPDSFSEAFEYHVRRVGLPSIRLHDLRHTHASLALQAGVHPKVVSERLGHATISITLDTYSHLVPAMQEEAAAKVADVVWGAS